MFFCLWETFAVCVLSSSVCTALGIMTSLCQSSLCPDKSGEVSDGLGLPHLGKGSPCGVCVNEFLSWASYNTIFLWLPPTGPIPYSSGSLLAKDSLSAGRRRDRGLKTVPCRGFYLVFFCSSFGKIPGELSELSHILDWSTSLTLTTSLTFAAVILLSSPTQPSCLISKTQQEQNSWTSS